MDVWSDYGEQNENKFIRGSVGIAPVVNKMSRWFGYAMRIGDMVAVRLVTCRRKERERKMEETEQ